MILGFKGFEVIFHLLTLFEKKITIIGQNNRYQMKKVMKEEKKMSDDNIMLYYYFTL